MTRARQPADSDAGYMRVSKVDVDDRDDLDAAVVRLVEVRAAELRDAAGRHSREIPDARMFVDMDVSGTTVAQRPGMTALIEAARRGEFSRLWVKNLSRLFRNLEEQIAYVRIIESAGVRIISLQEPSEGEKPLLDLTRNMLGAVNQYLAAATGQQIKANNRIVASTGRLPGGTAPLGYIYDKTSKEMTPDPDRRADAIRIFETYAEVGTYIGTAERLNAAGIPTRTGHSWRHDKVKAVVTSPIYRGRIHFCGETWPGRHEPIIPAELIERVDARIEAGRHRWDMSPRAGAVQAARTYSGLLTCGLCGDTIRAKPNRWNGTEYCYWTCSARQDRRSCNMPLYRTAELDHFVREGIKLAIGHELEALKRFAEENPSPIAAPSRHSSGPSRTAIEAKMLRISTEYAEGHMPQAQYRILMDRYQAQIREAEQQREQPAREPIKPAEIEAFREELDARWADASESERRQLIHAIAPRIRVYPDKLVLNTMLSIGDIAIPTMMFEPAPDPHPDRRARADHDPEEDFGHRAPDRTDTIIPTKALDYTLSEIGRDLRGVLS